MPGSVAIVRTSKDISKIRQKEVLITLTCVSDSSVGTIPNTALAGLGEYELVSIQPIPGSTPPDASFSVVINDANGAEIFDSDEFEVGDDQPVSGKSGSPTGEIPSLTDEMTLMIAKPIYHHLQADIGDSKDLIIIMVLKKK